jgi:hypothetical protein
VVCDTQQRWCTILRKLDTLGCCETRIPGE